MRLFAPILATAFLLLCLASCVQADSKDATFGPICECERTHSGGCLVPEGLVFSYCGQGEITLLNSSTVSLPMCCESLTADAAARLNASSLPWQCRGYSGPSGGARQIVSGYQCVQADVSVLTAALIALILVLAVTLLCLAPCAVTCLCCYCCGRCRRSPDSVPVVLLNVTPSWMLLSPQHADPYYRIS